MCDACVAYSHGRSPWASGVVLAKAGDDDESKSRQSASSCCWRCAGGRPGAPERRAHLRRRSRLRRCLAYGATRLKTPNIDRLAREGLRFTDAHATAATCTPSRYAMLTGEYAWRKPGTGVLPGNAALIIEPGRTTLATVFQRAGYATGVVGKWHLGLGPRAVPTGTARSGRARPTSASTPPSSWPPPATGCRPSTSRIAGSPGSIPPIRSACSYGKPLGDWPTGRGNPDLLKLHPSHGHDQTIVNGISRIGYMTGGKAALWKDEDMADVFTRKATAFIEQHRAKPFFLFFSPHDPHVPRVPHPRFAGATTMGPRGDAIAQLDWSVGEVLATLDRLGLAAEHARPLHERQRTGPRRWLSRRGRGETRRPYARGTVSRRKVQQLRRRHARAVRGALAGAGEAGRLRCARLAGRSDRLVLGARRSPLTAPATGAGQRERPAGAARSVEDRTDAAGRAGRIGLRSGRDRGSTLPPARARGSSRTPTRSSATIPSRSSTTSPAIQASGTISRRPVRRRFASWPRCSRRSPPGADAGTRATPEHRPRHRR